MNEGVTAKDSPIYDFSTDHRWRNRLFLEYAGEAVENLSMEGRMTLCNLSIEMGARGGMIAPDEPPLLILKIANLPKGDKWEEAVAYWRTLKSDADAVFDKEVVFDASQIKPMITYGTNPGMAMPIDGHIPEPQGNDAAGKNSFEKALNYMGFKPGEKLEGKPVDYVFLGRCSTGRIEDFRMFAHTSKEKESRPYYGMACSGVGRFANRSRKKDWIRFLKRRFQPRQPGCSACLARTTIKSPPASMPFLLRTEISKDVKVPVHAPFWPVRL